MPPPDPSNLDTWSQVQTREEQGRPVGHLDAWTRAFKETAIAPLLLAAAAAQAGEDILQKLWKQQYRRF